MTAPEVTVAVVSWNTRELLGRCLRSLAAAAEAGIASVVVVDNGSTDGSAELVEREHRWATLVRPGANLGFGPAVNLVAATSSAEWVAAANADVALLPGALEAMLAAGRNPAVGAVAPKLVMPDGRPQHSVHPFPGLGLALAFNLGLGRLAPRLGERLCLPGRWDPERPRNVDWALGAWLLVRRSAFDAVEGFDPCQWMYAEDLDLCWRLRRAGWRVAYEPRAEVRHEVSAATRAAFAGERERRHIAAAYAWMARRRGIGAAWAYAAINVAGAGIRLLALVPLAAVLPERFGRSRRRLARYLRLHRAGLRRRRRLVAETGASAAAHQ